MSPIRGQRLDAAVNRDRDPHWTPIGVTSGPERACSRSPGAGGFPARPRRACQHGRVKDVLGAVAGLVPAPAGPDCVLVGVDGVDGAGKTTFADALATRIARDGRPVVRIGIDDFHRPRAERYRQGRDSPDGFYEDSYDYARFLRDVLVPLGLGGDRRYRPVAHELSSDRYLDPPVRIAPPGAVVVVDGIFLQRPELADSWRLTVFLDVPFTETARRMAGRDGSSPDPDDPGLRRYVLGQRRYLREVRPRERADVLIDNTDVTRPRLLRPTDV